MTSRNDGWSNTLNEAMRLGCVPVVIDSFSAIDDIVCDEQDGIIIPQSSDETEITNLVEAISKLIKKM